MNRPVFGSPFPQDIKVHIKIYLTIETLEVFDPFFGNEVC